MRSRIIDGDAIACDSTGVVASSSAVASKVGGTVRPSALDRILGGM
jgi:hypothetical protein